MNELLQRLKERKLVQWALAYVAAAFAILQGIDIVAQRFGWPEQIMRLVIMTLSIGLFVTLVLAWYHGERGAQRVNGTELLILALLLAVGGAFLWQFASGARRSAVEKRPNEQTAVALPASAIPDKSIAVLPFDNLSDDKSNSYFAEGVQDEILTRLARVADLKVISRTSTQKYKSAPDNLREIAKQLGVMHVVEGSVQKAADQVRVNVQLINAMNDAHLWADTYDRKLTDIFAVESEISKTIADMLQAKLSGSEEKAMSQKPTENPEAHELYLKGRFLWNKRTAADLRKSIDYFNQAIAKDPNYAPAYVGLAQTWMVLSAYNGGAPVETCPKAEVAARKALALDDTSTDALVALASYKAVYQFDYAGALKGYERAIQLNPNDATAHHWLATDVLATIGDCDREVAEMKRAIELDPLSLVLQTNLANAYMHSGRLDEAIAQFRKTIELDGSFYFAQWSYGLALELQGKIPEATVQYEKAAAISDDPIVLGMLGHIYGITGRKDEAQKLLERLRESRKERYTSAYALALISLGLGDRADALDWLEQAYRDHDGNNIGPIRIDPLLIPLHGDPRYEALAEKILPARQFAKSATTSK